jgi:LPXTG-motif cell wall-anchored protein
MPGDTTQLIEVSDNIATYRQPTADGGYVPGIYLFQFKAPSYEDQTASADGLLSISFTYFIQLSPYLVPETAVTTVVQADAETVDGSTVASQQIGAQMTVAESLTSQQTDEQDGTFRYFQTYAPATQQITPDGTLQFSARVGAGYANYHNNSANPAFTGHDDTGDSISKYIINYKVDVHLNIDGLYLSLPVLDHGGSDNFGTLTALPKCDLYVKYQDSDAFEITDLTDYTDGVVNLNEYVNNARGVDQLKLVFTTIQSGMSYYNGISFLATPKSGYYGTVTNDLSVEVAGIVYGGYYDILYSKNGATVLPGSYNTADTEEDVGKDYNAIFWTEYGDEYSWSDDEIADQIAMMKSMMAPQSAEIVKPAESAAIINENATFAKADNGVVNEGDNQLQISISNDEVATDYLTGVTTSVVLPKGVSYNGNVAGVQVLDSDYQGTGQTLLGITWASDAITPGRANTVNLPVTVAAVSGLNQLSIGVYSNVDGDTATALNSDQLDATVPVIAGNYDFLDADRLAFGRMITYGSTLTQDATLVRLIGTTFSQIAAGQTGTANLQFSKDTADALNQLTVTGSVVSGTGLTLNGPVTLPDNWQNQATVTYTTETDPTTAIDWQSADSVTDYSQVTGFKIRYQKSGSYLAGGAQTIAVPVTLAETTNLGQMVGLVYTVAADNLPVIDGIQSVIDVTAPVQIKTTVGPAISVTADDYYDYTHPITKTAVGPAVSVTADQYYDHTTPDPTTTTKPGDNSKPQPGATDEPQPITPVQGKSQLDKLQQPAKKISLTGIPLHLQPLTISTSTDVQFGTAVLESGEPADSSTTGNSQQVIDRTTTDGTDDSTKSSTFNSQGRTDNEATTNESHNSAGVASNRTGVRGMSATTVNGRTQNSKLANGQNSVQAGTTASKPDEKGWLPQTAEKALLWAALLGLIGLATATWYKLKKLRKND